MPPIRKLSEVLTPAREESFGAIIRALSEPETGPPADNLVSNEDSYPRVAGEIEALAPPDGVYLGVGPDQNFTFLARCRPRLAFVLDFRRRNLLLHLLHKALMSVSEDRVAYLSRLTARHPGPLPANPTAEDLVAGFGPARFERERLDATIAEVAAALKPLGVVGEHEWPALATIQAKLAGPGMGARFLALKMYPTFGQLIRTPDRAGRPAHFLAREESYRAVRSLQVGDRLIPLVGDFGARTSLEKLAAWLRRHGLAVSVFYISDVEFFLLRGGRFPDYVASLAGLPWSRGALLIRTSTREIDHPERVHGDSATTIVRHVTPFLEEARAGRIRGVDDLFAGR